MSSDMMQIQKAILQVQYDHRPSAGELKARQLGDLHRSESEAKAKPATQTSRPRHRWLALPR